MINGLPYYNETFVVFTWLKQHKFAYLVSSVKSLVFRHDIMVRGVMVLFEDELPVRRMTELTSISVSI
jgi:hypothetical protein